MTDIDGAKVFSSDNTAGAAPEVVAAVAQAATGIEAPYGHDTWTAHLHERTSEVFEREVDVLPVSTGSAANSLCLAALTPPWGSILCHADAHIANDECGAPGFFTHGATLSLVGGDDQARMDPEQVRLEAARKRGDVHGVQPSAVSLSQTTETGAVLALDEVHALTDVARECGLRTHMDGARFANAVAALGCSPADLTWRAGIDLLSFGATKNGAMTADAIVVLDRSLTPELHFRAKRAGQLTSKMRFQSAQLVGYLGDDVWLRNARHANAMAARLAHGLDGLPGVARLGAAESNILFVRFAPDVLDRLVSSGFVFYHDRWEPGVARLVTSFATTPAAVDAFVATARGQAG